MVIIIINNILFYQTTYYTEYYNLVIFRATLYNKNRKFNSALLFVNSKFYLLTNNIHLKK